MSIRFAKILCLFLLFLLQWSARADDIDLFAPKAASSTTAPNALFIIDNAGSFNSSAADCKLPDGTAASMSGKVSGLEQCAIYKVIDSLDVSATSKTPINVGVMVYNANNGVRDYLGNACPGGTGQGGCLVYPITFMNSTSKPILLAWIKSWNSGNGVGAIQSNNQKTGAVMQEAWAYWAGRKGLSGVDYSTLARPPAGCAQNYNIFIGNSWANSGKPGDSTGTPKSALEGLLTGSNALMNAYPADTANQTSGSTKLILPATGNNATASCGSVSISNSSIPGSASSHESSGSFADEWARYMATQSITTYAVVLKSAACQPEYAWLMEQMANVSNGKYIEATDVASLIVAINTVLGEVQSVNSAFASVSLPVSVNTQGTYLNQVFVGMFRPDPESKPRWFGNLKQYKMGYSGSTFQLLDADNSPAITSSQTSDFISECGRSFWTPALTSTDTYWTGINVPNCPGYPAQSNTPDGNLVEKGGQAYVLRSISPTARVMKTCPLGASCALPGFSTTSSGLSSAVVNWTLGANKADSDESPSLATTLMRPSVHGDVVHSRPVAINFGTDASPKVVVFYGGNDGVLRAINGNRTANIGASPATVFAAGAELWSFLPPEFYSKLQRLYDNTSLIAAGPIAGTAKDYGMDGTVTSYVASAASDGWIFASMRRGGSAVYAFNVSRSDPSNISFKWKVGCDSGGCFNATGTADNSGAFSAMGQSWASPKFFTASGYGSGASPLMIMGGGYDPTCEDAASCTAATKGNRIFVMDPGTGNLLKYFNTTRAVTGDVAMLQDRYGQATYGYATDLGGNIYRIAGPVVAGVTTAIGTNAPATWTITQIASLGCASPGTCTSPPNRKFMYGPNVVVEGGFNIVLVGSGDREKPTNTSNAVTNYFYAIKDNPADATWLTSEAVSGRCGAGNNLMCMASLAGGLSGSSISVGTCAVPSASDKGWALKLLPNEQVVTAAITVTGTVYFSTSEPYVVAAGATLAEMCKPNLGRARAYALSYTNASSGGVCNADGTTATPFVLLKGGGLPPTPVAGKVVLDDGSVVPFCIGCTGGLQSKKVTAPSVTPKSTKVRSYYYLQK